MLRGWTAVALLSCLLACDDEGGAEPAVSTASTTGESTTGVEPSTSGAATSTTGAAATNVASTSAADESTSSTGAGSTSTGVAETGSSSSGGSIVDGLGEISGRCGVLSLADLQSDGPRFVVNAIDFDVGFDYDQLTPGGQEVHDEGNLGGSSLFSEVISYDVLDRCEGAALLKTEGEIVYTDEMGTKTDLLIELEGLRIGVSVTRALAFPFDDPYSVEQAQVLLEDKLGDIPSSSANVAPEDAWTKQILHVLAYGPMHAQSLEAAYDGLDPAVQLDTIVVVTVTDGDDLFLYE